MAKTTKGRDVPATLAFIRNASGEVTLRDGTGVAQSFPSDDGLAVAKVIHTLIGKKLAVNPFCFYAPVYDAQGKTVPAKDEKGAVILSANGRSVVAQQHDLAKAIKLAEAGELMAMVVPGKWGQFRVKFYPPHTAKTAKAGGEIIDLNALLGGK